MNKKFIILLLYKITFFLLILSCDLSENTPQNKMNDISNLEKKYMDDLDYKCLSKKESVKFKDSQKLDINNNKNSSYYSRISNFSNSHNKTRTFCETRWLILSKKQKNARPTNSLIRKAFNLYLCLYKCETN